MGDSGAVVAADQLYSEGSDGGGVLFKLLPIPSLCAGRAYSKKVIFSSYNMENHSFLK